jgi:hypothetical protein
MQSQFEILILCNLVLRKKIVSTSPVLGNQLMSHDADADVANQSSHGLQASARLRLKFGRTISSVVWLQEMKHIAY